VTVKTPLVHRRPHDVAPAGAWRTDAAAGAQLVIVAQHLFPRNVFGPFAEDVTARIPVSAGLVVVADDRATSTLDLELDMAALSCGHRRVHDTMLKSAAVLDVAHFPSATLQGRLVHGRSHARFVGGFTRRGVHHHVGLDDGRSGFVRDHTRDDVGTFTLAGTIDRFEWGLSSNTVTPPEDVILARHARIELTLPAAHEP
jgi:polyisoprenoid-binding protein YceI